MKKFSDILLIIVGAGIYAFGLVYLNIANDLAEGGISGITLILRALFQIDPAYSTLIINIPLILIGRRVLGNQSFVYTLVGTVSLSGFLWVWQRVPFEINLQHDLLIAALLAGLVGGVGSGLVYRVGGTTGGTDIMARVLEKYFGLTMGKTMLAFDIVVLILSLTYIDLKLMMYTLICSYVFSRVIDSFLDGGYAAKGLLVISNYSPEIAPLLMSQLERGITFLEGSGGFSAQPTQVIYMVVSPRELRQVKEIVMEIDPRAFVSVINVHEVEGEGFTYLKPQVKFLQKLKRGNQ